MPQALRQHRRPELSRKKLTVSILLLLTCALVMPGCASLGLSDQLLSEASSWRDETSTIRSQNSPEADDASRKASAVAADYSPLRASNNSAGTNPGASTNSNGVIPVFSTGHAFVQRRAKLGKPIPIHDKIETRSAERIESIAPSAENQNFNMTGDNAPSQMQAPVGRDGISFGTVGWQPAPNTDIAQFRGPAVNTPRQDNLPAKANGWDSSALRNATAEPLSADGRPIASSQSDTQAALIEDAATQDSPGVTTNGINLEGAAEAAAVVDRDNAIPKEQTVFDRLRGFYTPRRDETALERGRRANRRWTDPFGLMREREPEVVDSPLGATSPVPSNPEMTSPVTTDLDATASPDEITSLFEPLIAKVENDLSEWPRHSNGKPQNEVAWLQQQTDLRLLYLMAGRSAESMRAIESLPEKEQEFWQTMMLAMEAYRGSDDSASRTEQLTETLDYVRTASRQLQPLSMMKIRRMNFCNRIEGFGSFNVFPSSDFNAGQPLLLYAEIENYKSALTDDGQYRSEFAAMIEFIREGETEPIASRTIRLPEIEDLCAAERTDYFQSYELTIPSLSPGRYTLRLRVRDQLSLQTATSDLPFDIRPLGSGN